MGNAFDNSGKNTENEIYDTSHRQYWAPPGNAAWKDNLIGFFGIVLSVILVMLFDCFVLHPIPAPEGTFDIHGSPPDFVLSESGCEYADAKILSSDTTWSGNELFLVEQNNEIHLLVFQESVFFTRKIADDVIITGELPQTLKVRNGLVFSSVDISEHLTIENVNSFGAGNARQTVITIYIVIGVAIALTGSFIWHKIKKLFK